MAAVAAPGCASGAYLLSMWYFAQSIFVGGSAMAPRRRNTPLALAVLMCLYERPMHPYEVATTLRHRRKNESVRLNYGSLYAVVGSLEKRGLIETSEVEREGRLPERTVYRITDSGRVE